MQYLTDKKWIFLLLAAGLLLSSCGRKAEAEGQTGNPDSGSGSEVIVYETYPGTVEARESDGDAKDYFGVMTAEILDVQEIDGRGTVLKLKDQQDPDNAWTVSTQEIGALETEPEVGKQVSVLFRGDIEADPENTEFVAVFDGGDGIVKRAPGVTVSNRMSTFSVKTDSGTTLTFQKDGCRIEKDALISDNGDPVVVYYAGDGSGNLFPAAVYKKE